MARFGWACHCVGGVADAASAGGSYVGGSEALAQSISCVRYGGSIAVIGRLSGSAPVQLDPAELFLANKRLIGLMAGSRATACELVRFVELQQLRPVIDRVFGFDHGVDAFDYLGSGGHFGKVVIELAADQGGRGPRRQARGAVWVEADPVQTPAAPQRHPTSSSAAWRRKGSLPARRTAPGSMA
jgi:hypothetical protein